MSKKIFGNDLVAIRKSKALLVVYNLGVTGGFTRLGYFWAWCIKKCWAQKLDKKNCSNSQSF